MSYTLTEYINAKLSIPEYEQRFKALEPLVRVYRKDYDDIKHAMENHEWGLERLKEIQEKLDDLRQDMENIIVVIELKKAGEI